MIDQTKIEWTDFTVNFWEGCQKVGPGCDHCYAEARDARFTGGTHWGPGAPRRKVKGGIAKLRKIQREAEAFHEAHGRWPRIFCSSLSDIFDNAVDPAWREEAFAEIDRAAHTRPQLLTKRVGNVEKMIPPMWRDGGWPAHVGLMITVVNQEEADRDVPKLLALKGRFGIPWVGLSMEPLLGPVDLTKLDICGEGETDALNPVPWRDEIERWRDTDPEWQEGLIDWFGLADMPDPETMMHPTLDWVIVGGESGPGARPMHPDWARSLRDQCQAAGVAFHFKQWGEWAPGEVAGPNERPIEAADWWDDQWRYERVGKARPDQHYEDEPYMFRIGKRAAGRQLDGRTWDEVPG
ncbi:phage Gp37/Gp68 family protein [Salipiger mucosus]|uniref:Bacteriophage protein gp37 n=1 Tax=Salipiger mucosus DSM 16094 TaxID=1123237 RepID=S9QL38_9RHOB|nr:phage Gp37/Gp68 family protein [Salipiger mucosus]EPX80497.1 Bacteriophage protein gp37 [Salipiger mucosus DSM 16094]